MVVSSSNWCGSINLVAGLTTCYSECQRLLKHCSAKAAAKSDQEKVARLPYDFLASFLKDAYVEEDANLAIVHLHRGAHQYGSRTYISKTYDSTHQQDKCIDIVMYETPNFSMSSLRSDAKSRRQNTSRIPRHDRYVQHH